MLRYLLIRLAYQALALSLSGLDRSTSLSAGARRRLARIIKLASSAQRQLLYEQSREQYGDVVHSGIFAGMKLTPSALWAGGDRLSTLLGCYEEELAAFIEGLRHEHLSRVIDVGAAEGYYAVGFARILDVDRVIAADTCVEALEICKRNAELNEVGHKLECRSDAMTAKELVALLESYPESLVFCDIEGGELELITEEVARAGSRSWMIVESHPFSVPGTTDHLVRVLGATHELQIIEEGARNPNRFEPLRSRSSIDRWLAMSEGRPQCMQWICAIPRSADSRAREPLTC